VIKPNENRREKGRFREIKHAILIEGFADLAANLPCCPPNVVVAVRLCHVQTCALSGFPKQKLIMYKLEVSLPNRPFRGVGKLKN
jgi:hypothetical protein